MTKRGPNAIQGVKGLSALGESSRAHDLSEAQQILDYYDQLEMLSKDTI
jgi:hypothetical protein